MFKKITSVVFCLALFCTVAEAAAGKKQGQNKASIIPAPIETHLVVDGKSGKVLHAKNADVKIYPASLTKVAGLYLIFEALQSGRLSMNDKVLISKKAETVIPLKLHLKAGEYITVRDAVLGIIVHSANDCSIAMAEHLAGTEENFAKLMTRKARQLGMSNTTFKNSSGLHHPEQKSTALDLARMSIAIKRDYPRFYPLFSRTSFEFRGRTVNGHNPVTANYEGAEGLKTGFTTPAGSNLITTASRNGKFLVGVVTGSKNKHVRNNTMVKLLDTHFGVTTAKATPEKTKIIPGKKSKKTVKTAYNTKKKVVRS